MGSFNRTVGADAARYDGAPGRIFGLAGALPYRNAKYKALQSVHGTDMHNISKKEHADKVAKKAAEKEAKQKADGKKTKPIADVNSEISEFMGGPKPAKTPTSRTPLHPTHPVASTEQQRTPNWQPIGMPYRKAPLRSGWTERVDGRFQASPAHEKLKTALANENAGRKAQLEAQGHGHEFVPKRMPGERKDPKNPKLEQPFAAPRTPSAGTGAQKPPAPRKKTSLSTNPL
jgi:hypothetical protein